MNIFTGHQLRLERQRLRLSLHGLAGLANCPGASAQQLSCFEYGGRLREDVLRRLEYVLESLDIIQRSFPFSLNTKDVASLKLALAAYERGDTRWFTEREVKPELPDVITF
jgi:hypothetical protein